MLAGADRIRILATRREVGDRSCLNNLVGTVTERVLACTLSDCALIASERHCRVDWSLWPMLVVHPPQDPILMVDAQSLVPHSKIKELMPADELNFTRAYAVVRRMWSVGCRRR